VPSSNRLEEAHALLKAHGFERLHIGIAPPERWELWQNSRGKTVQIEFSDATLNFFSLDEIDFPQVGRAYSAAGWDQAANASGYHSFDRLEQVPRRPGPVVPQCL
jgi:hypothetical protein